MAAGESVAELHQLPPFGGARSLPAFSPSVAHVPHSMNDSVTDEPVDVTDDGLDAPTVVPSRSTAALLPSLDAANRRIDDYELQGEIARGSMGVVFKAKHLGLGRVVALKMILDNSGHTELARKRFENEARAAASLDHPGIVPVYDVGSHDGCPYFTMAYVPGQSLAALLAAGPIPPIRAAEIAERIARAAAHAHEKRVVHRDLKPANVLLDSHGEPHVTDFGVSKSLESGCELTSSGEVIGTPHYMPPEQAGGRHVEIGPHSDVYSIGAILYAMLTGRPPFQAATPIEVIAQVLQNEPVSPSALNASVPADLEVITLKCLNKSPRDRYASADELGDDLNRFLHHQPILAKPPGWVRKLRYLVGKHLIWASVSGSAALVLVMLTSIVAIGFVRAQARVLDLEDQLAIAQQQFTTDRSTLAKFLAMQGDRVFTSEDLARLELERITAASEMLRAAGKEELAIQLTVEAVLYAQQHSLPIPTDMLDQLRAAARSKPLTPESEPPADDLTNDAELAELVDCVRQTFLAPLSDSQREIFGLPIPDTDPSVTETIR